MALIRIDHVPETVKLNISLNVIVPDPASIDELPLIERKVLYLLHGLSDDASAWQRYTSIETLAGAYGLVVVMPSAGRSFYCDLPNGQLYFTYLTEELPPPGEPFPARPRREDTLSPATPWAATAPSRPFSPRALRRRGLFGMLSLDFLKYFPDDPRLRSFAIYSGSWRSAGQRT